MILGLVIQSTGAQNIQIASGYFLDQDPLMARAHSQTELFPDLSLDTPIFTIWYGLDQKFGNLGSSQKWVSILGNVSDPEGIASLTFKLNGGAAHALSRGEDTRRLAQTGDFNVEIDRADLNLGLNQVVITAVSSLNKTNSVTVNVTYAANTWPLPYTIDWSTVTNIQDAVQVIDGQWQLVPGGLRTAQVDYDRVIGLGDISWVNYEITLPITIHALDPDGYLWPSVSPGFGLQLRWQGHTDNPVVCGQPHCGWVPAGAGTWYDLGNNGPLVMDGVQDLSVQMNIGDTYYWKMRVENKVGVGPLYAVKVWKQGDAEPATWNITKQRDLTGVTNGSPILIAHHVDLTVGIVSIVPIYTHSVHLPQLMREP